MSLSRLLTLLILVLLFSAKPLRADTATKTWADGEWNTDWTAVTVVNECDVTSTYTYQSTGGNPTHNWYAYCEGRNDSLTGHVDWTGTWETLGVTAGNTVSTIQMTDADTNCTDYATCDTATFGPFELRDSGDTLVATMWSGRTATVDEDAWTAEGSQTAQSVGSLTASDSSIELWWNITMITANAKNAACGGRWDNLDISIEHSTPAAAGLNQMMITRVRFKRGKHGEIQPVVLGTSIVADRRMGTDGAARAGDAIRPLHRSTPLRPRRQRHPVGRVDDRGRGRGAGVERAGTAPGAEGALSWSASAAVQPSTGPHPRPARQRAARVSRRQPDHGLQEIER